MESFVTRNTARAAIRADSRALALSRGELLNERTSPERRVRFQGRALTLSRGVLHGKVHRSSDAKGQSRALTLTCRELIDGECRPSEAESETFLKEYQ